MTLFNFDMKSRMTLYVFIGTPETNASLRPFMANNPYRVYLNSTFLSIKYQSLTTILLEDNSDTLFYTCVVSRDSIEIDAFAKRLVIVEN